MCFFLSSFKFFLQPLCISLVPLIFPYSAQILLENAFSAGKMLASKIAYSTRNSARRIYPNLRKARFVELRSFFGMSRHNFPHRRHHKLVSFGGGSGIMNHES